MTPGGTQPAEAMGFTGEKVAIVFPGQGAQVPGFGIPWAAHPAWDVVREAEEVLRRSLDHLLLDDGEQALGSTADVQLGVFLGSVMVWRAFAAHLGAEVIAFAGHSLGQYSALVASGTLDLATGTELVARRGEVTAKAAQRDPGGMVALLGASIQQAQEAAAAGGCWVANDNAPGQVVLSGPLAALEKAVAAARDLGVRKAMPLAVQGAFHSPLMATAAQSFAPHVAAATFRRPSAPIVANHDATAHVDPNWAERLITHLITGVRWRESQHTLVDLGATRMVELGPGETLAGIARRTVPTMQVTSLASPDAADLLLEGAR
jgi:[acyl-carrier-protein] S-malonyltransferase